MRHKWLFIQDYTSMYVYVQIGMQRLLYFHSHIFPFQTLLPSPALFRWSEPHSFAPEVDLAWLKAGRSFPPETGSILVRGTWFSHTQLKFMCCLNQIMGMCKCWPEVLIRETWGTAEREKERENRSPETLKDKRLKEGIGDKHGVFNWVPTSCSGSRGPSMQHSKCGR